MPSRSLDPETMKWEPNASDRAVLHLLMVPPGTPNPEDTEEKHPAFAQLVEVHDGVPIGTRLVARLCGEDGVVLPIDHAEFALALNFDTRYRSVNFPLHRQEAVRDLALAVQSLDGEWGFWINRSRQVFIGHEVVEEPEPVAEVTPVRCGTIPCSGITHRLVGPEYRISAGGGKPLALRQCAACRGLFQAE
jgi:hypothetical protein